MKNRINKYFFQQFLYNFSIVLFSLASIVWIVQAVNFLDLVVEDGHAFSVYFSYSLLTIPKIITRLIPFCFLTAVLLTILKLEKDNELIVLWTSGLNKMKIVNFIFFLSLLVMIIQLIMASTISPASGSFSRSLIKQSSLHFLPTLIKAKKFIDVVEDVTFFVEKKSSDGIMENVFIRDENKILKDSSQKSSTIYAKEGYINQKKNKKFLILFNGSIQKESLDGKINFIKFDKIILNLDNLTTKSIVTPKIQETPTRLLVECATDSYFLNQYVSQFFKMFSQKTNIQKIKKYNCDKSNNSIIIELNRRLGMPFYIPVLALIASFLLSSKRESRMSGWNKFIYFFIGFSVLVFAEIALRYSAEYFYTLLYYSLPFAIIALIYVILLKIFKFESLA